MAWSGFFWWWALLGLAAAGGLSAAYGLREARRRRLERKRPLFCCAACRFVYLGRRKAEREVCPRCGRENERLK